jgi:lipopolysaccharide biosynthesis glycosyltransferase
LIDCNRWNKINLTKKTIEFAKKFPTKLENVDQDAINYTCQEYIKILNRKYNQEVKQSDKKNRNKIQKYCYN